MDDTKQVQAKGQFHQITVLGNSCSDVMTG